VRTYLYGLILSRNAHLVPAHITGIRGTALTVMPCGDIAALVGSVDAADHRDLDALRAHDHAVQSVVHHGATTSAVRFGQTFGDAVELRRHLAEHAAQISETLQRLDGHVEMRLLMSLPPGEPAETTAQSPGRAYLESLRASNRVSGLALRSALGPVVRAEHVEELPRSSGVAFAHLIMRAEETTYREAVASHPALGDAKIVGPLALYSFAEVAA
jgi:hypothetical protein